MKWPVKCLFLVKEFVKNLTKVLDKRFVMLEDVSTGTEQAADKLTKYYKLLRSYTMQVAQAMNKAQKANEKKTHTVAKGTLSLAGDMNKRSTDKDSHTLANDTMPAAAEKALVDAAQALHDTVTKAATVAAGPQDSKKTDNGFDLGEFPMIVPRVDLLQNRVIFLAHTQKKDTGEIQYINLKDGVLNTAPVEYYRSTKPVDEEATLKDMVRKFSSLTGSKNFHLRKRLVKSHVLERDEDGKVDAKGLDDLQVKLLKAVKQFEDAIKAAFTA